MQNEDEDLDYISKTQLKAEAEAQQMVGKKLLDLTKGQLIKLNLDESLHEAVIEAKRLNSNGAIKRQLQYIGRLMRSTDIEPIKEKLAGWEGKNNTENARFHVLERWRDRLIEEAATSQSDSLQEFVTKYPHAEIQKLRTLVRNANKEKAANKTLKSSRELFKLIREITEVQEGLNENDSD
ncbi:MAG: ribosome-associated protein [Methylophilaceae bacterium]|jgi:ribosome-associated protein|tara:strand:+ start:1848 stop:2390 length:543 start_codon:yes stop_codon:yes gene_type:complete